MSEGSFYINVGAISFEQNIGYNIVKKKIVSVKMNMIVTIVMQEHLSVQKM